MACFGRSTGHGEHTGDRVRVLEDRCSPYSLYLRRRVRDDMSGNARFTDLST